MKTTNYKRLHKTFRLQTIPQSNASTQNSSSTRYHSRNSSEPSATTPENTRKRSKSTNASLRQQCLQSKRTHRSQTQSNQQNGQHCQQHWRDRITSLTSSLLQTVERIQIGGLRIEGRNKPIDWQHQSYVRSQETQLNWELNGKKQKSVHIRKQH